MIAPPTRQLLVASALVGALALSAPGAHAAAGDGCVVIRGVEVAGIGQPGPQDVVVRAGRVAAVAAAGADVPGDCRVVDGAGRVLTPGLVDPHSQLGLVEISGEERTVDTDLEPPHAATQPEVRAALRAELAYNPRSTPIPVARLGGVTSVIVVPTGGTIRGRSFWADLAGATQAEAIRAVDIAMNASFGGRAKSRAAALHVLDVALTEADELARRSRDFEQNRTPGFTTPPRDLRALLPVAQGRMPLVVSADRAADIEALLSVTEGTPVRLVIAGGAEAWLVRGALAARGVPVILDPLRYGPGGFDQVHARRDNAALLHAAGVPIMFSSFGAYGVRKLRQLAGNAAREGLDHQAALDAITRTPAEVFGQHDLGRVAPGAVANLALWSGDPLELETRLEGLWIGGREVALTSRQTVLRDRYRRVSPAP